MVDKSKIGNINQYFFCSKKIQKMRDTQVPRLKFKILLFHDHLIFSTY